MNSRESTAAFCGVQMEKGKPKMVRCLAFGVPAALMKDLIFESQQSGRAQFVTSSIASRIRQQDS
jgi:hypothetical protein